MSIIKELYQYREMIFSLIRKDLRGRYKGSVLGIMWTFINPLLQLAVYTVVFSFLFRLCHNKQLINSHFCRGASKLPYKLKFSFYLLLHCNNMLEFPTFSIGFRLFVRTTNLTNNTILQ